MNHSIFTTALAFVDLAFMLLQLNIGLIRAVTGQSAITINRCMCKFSVGFGYLCIHLDAWLLCGLSAERSIKIFWPMRAKHIVTQRKIKVFLVIIFILFLLCNTESSVRHDLVEIRKQGALIQNCQPVYFYGLASKYLIFKDFILVVIGIFIPLVFISICNVAILIRLAWRKQLQTETGDNRGDSYDNRTNAMLITLMLAYILLNSPGQVYVITIALYEKDFNDGILRIFVVLTTVGMALNFYLYSVSSCLFRQAVKHMLQTKSNVAGHPGGVSIETGRGRLSNRRARYAYHCPGREVNTPPNARRIKRYSDLFRQHHTTAV